MKNLIAATMVATMAMTGAASANAFTHFFKDLGHKIEAQNKKTNRAFVNVFGKKLPKSISKSNHDIGKAAFFVGKGIACAAGTGTSSKPCDGLLGADFDTPFYADNGDAILFAGKP